MKLIDKKLVTIDLSSGSEAVANNISQHTDIEGLIIACDTQDHIVFLSEQEVERSINALPTSLIEEFNSAYSIDEDIHDCIEKDGLMDDIVLTVLKNLNIKQIKFFTALQDECELALMNKYEVNQLLSLYEKSEYGQLKTENDYLEFAITYRDESLDHDQFMFYSKILEDIENNNFKNVTFTVFSHAFGKKTFEDDLINKRFLTDSLLEKLKSVQDECGLSLYKVGDTVLIKDDDDFFEDKDALASYAGTPMTISKVLDRHNYKTKELGNSMEINDVDIAHKIEYKTTLSYINEYSSSDDTFFVDIKYTHPNGDIFQEAEYASREKIKVLLGDIPPALTMEHLEPNEVKEIINALYKNPISSFVNDNKQSNIQHLKG